MRNDRDRTGGNSNGLQKDGGAAKANGEKRRNLAVVVNRMDQIRMVDHGRRRKEEDRRRKPRRLMFGCWKMIKKR